MKYQHIPGVLPGLAAKAQEDIEKVNKYIDGLRGTIISIERIRSGQAKPYADSVDEALIFCHQPNVFSNNAPGMRTITRKQAETLARTFVSNWKDEPVFLDSRLECLEPAPNPCGVVETKYQSRADEEVRSSCWRVVVRHPYND